MSQFTFPVLPLICPRVIGQRRLVAQHRAGTNDGGPAYVTTTPDDRVLHLRRSAHARVTPNDRVLNPRALFDVATFAQHRVDYLDAWLERALISNHRQLIDL